MNEQPTFNAWRGILFGLLISLPLWALLISLPLWALLIWDWCRGMIL